MDSSRLACVAVCIVFLMGLLATTGHGAKLSIFLEGRDHKNEYAVISCMASDIDRSAKQVEIIQIFKGQSNSKKILAHIFNEQNKIVYANEKHRFTGFGNIDKSAQDSFLFLTLNDPKAEDEGEYSCEVYNTDAAGVQQHTVSMGTLRLTKKIKPEVSKTDLEDLQKQIELLKSNDIDIKQKLQEQKKINDDLNDAQSRMTRLYKNLLDTVTMKGYGTKDTVDKSETSLGGSSDQDLAELNATLSKVKEDLQNKLEQLDKDLKDKDFKAFKEINDLANVTTHLNKAVDGLTLGAIESQGNMTAFCASLVNSLTAVVGNKIVFDSVQLNKGQGYDPQTGIFTAPRSGIYAFQLVVMFRVQDEWADLWIQKNGKLVTRLSSHDNTNDNQASTSAVVSLVAGDKVENVITYTSKYQSKLTELVNLRFSNFCGYFLQPL